MIDSNISDIDMLKKELITVDISSLEKAFMPMSESLFYILLSLHEPRHGYGISKYVSQLTEGRVRLSCATLYGTLSKLQSAGVICIYDESSNRIVYELTSRGRALLRSEISRLRKQTADAEIVADKV